MSWRQSVSHARERGRGACLVYCYVLVYREHEECLLSPMGEVMTGHLRGLL